MISKSSKYKYFQFYSRLTRNYLYCFPALEAPFNSIVD
ncbi:hypothetical protein J5U23_01726 [Saccharolobus shibatae B12]|uniref:Uncharacterized protein n=1 Tax=Saccharolobus shibatae (strain ATCC 51178 / DSM 5389 / JCM 8931 / NBRC 15437 / B12) TaxID=523848 RepID=A0A8F5BP48_SACSH|nr:hypothetical protein J5U23_01726 [Saccharolobus shibatae B12]